VQVRITRQSASKAKAPEGRQKRKAVVKKD
jgi:hypothetical protein